MKWFVIQFFHRSADTSLLEESIYVPKSVISGITCRLSLWEAPGRSCCISSNQVKVSKQSGCYESLQSLSHGLQPCPKLKSSFLVHIVGKHHTSERMGLEAAKLHVGFKPLPCLEFDISLR